MKQPQRVGPICTCELLQPELSVLQQFDTSETCIVVDMHHDAAVEDDSWLRKIFLQTLHQPGRLSRYILYYANMQMFSENVMKTLAIAIQLHVYMCRLMDNKVQIEPVTQNT